MATREYLNEVGLGQVWGKIKDYADPFIVIVTSTTSNGTTTYSADKTFAEITAAYNAGKVCFLKRTDGYYYGLSLINSTKIIFSQQFTASTYEISSVGSFTITSSNVITLNSHSVYGRTPIKNIYPRKTSIATINGTVPVTYMTGGNIEFNSTTATQAYTDGDLFWIGQYDLVKAITDISSGDTLTENTNYIVTTIDDELKLKPDFNDVLTKTNTTSYVPTGDYNPATKKYVDDKSVMFVNIQAHSEDGGETTTYTADKTYEELYYYIENIGGDAICNYMGNIYHLTSFGESGVFFCKSELYYDGNIPIVGSQYIAINNNNVVEVSDYFECEIPTTLSCATISEIEEMCDVLGFQSVTIDTSDYINDDE